jgi:hypothetical protein
MTSWIGYIDSHMRIAEHIIVIIPMGFHAFTHVQT